MFLNKIVNSRYFTVYFFFIWFLIFLGLSCFRDASLDENIYIGDSVEIANILQRGEWIGNYGIGLHGFGNKLIIGIIFIFTGPSVFIATFSNLLFAIFSGVVFFKILLKQLKLNKTVALLGVTMLFCSYQFLIYTPTFYRDIPALFFVLLIVYSILGKKNKWITGIFILLLLDSKEHVFYTIAPALVLWLMAESFLVNKGGLFEAIKNITLNGIKLFLPSLLYLILMFSTSIIPLNIYNANILGLIDGGLEIMFSNFSIESATYNRDLPFNVGIAKTIPIFTVPLGASDFTTAIISFINGGLLYGGKIFYPRTFSFLSIPLILLIPSLWFAHRYFIENFRKEDTEKLVLPLLLFIYLAIYIFHASISRYLLPISPLIILFFLMFLKDLKLKESYTRKTLLLTAIFISIGLYFEYSYLLVKVLINIFLLLLLFFIYYVKKEKKDFLIYTFIFLVASFSFGTSLLASYQYGQIGGYRMYGYNRECKKILDLVEKEDRIWINDISWDRLPFVLRRENLGQPEWRWSLKEWVPKKKLLKRDINLKTFNFSWDDVEIFKEEIYENKIQKVVYVKVKDQLPREDFRLQNRLKMLFDADWLVLTDTVKMKNKQIYIWEVYNK